MHFNKIFDSGTVQAHSQTWITDGVEREVAPGLTGKYIHENSKMTWQERLLSSGEMQSGTLFFDQDGNLIYQGDAYPAVVAVKIKYRRMDTN